MSKKKNTNIVARTLTSPAALGGAAGAGIMHRMVHKSRDQLHHSKWKDIRSFPKGKRLLAGTLLGAGGGYLIGHLRRLLSSKSLIGRVRKAENEGKVPTHYLTGSEKNMYKELTKKAADETYKGPKMTTRQAWAKASAKPGEHHLVDVTDAPTFTRETAKVEGAKMRKKYLAGLKKGRETAHVKAWDKAIDEPGKAHTAKAPIPRGEDLKALGAKMRKERASIMKGRTPPVTPSTDDPRTREYRERAAKLKKYRVRMKERDATRAAEKERLKSPWWKFWG